MAQCPPGTSRVVALKVRRIVAEQLGVEYGRIYPSSSFVDDLDAG
jgi:acyl carrier protein